MLGNKAKVFKTHPAICLEDLVPQDNFYRAVETKLDLTFVRDLVRDFYSSHMGRPSIDPVVFFKLQLIMFFEGFRSERQLMEQVNLNLAFRWYIGYDLNEIVPDHSTLSRIRDRYGLEVFQRFFERVVELCIEAGLVWGKELYFDGTKVRANAALEAMVPHFYYDAKQHLAELFTQKQWDEAGEEPSPETNDTIDSVPRGFVNKYNGTRLTGRRKHTYQRVADHRVSLTDPDATPMSRFTGDIAKLGYHTHYVVDGGKSRIILAVLVTPSSIMDNTPMLDLAYWTRFRWQLHPVMAVGDAKYGTIPNIVGLERSGIRAYLPTSDFSQRTEFYSSEQFQYDAERDLFICPQGHELPLWSRRKSEETYVYRADAATCNACPVKAKCNDSRSGRHLRRSFFQDELDRAAGYRETEAYAKAMNKRKVWPEPLFGEAKQWHNMRQFRLRHLEKVNIEGLIIAAGQNIKRLLRHKGWRKPLKPAATQVLAVPFPSTSPFFVPSSWLDGYFSRRWLDTSRTLIHPVEKSSVERADFFNRLVSFCDSIT